MNSLGFMSYPVLSMDVFEAFQITRNSYSQASHDRAR